MTITVDGEHTRARIHADQTLIEDDLLDQVQEIVDHEAFQQDIEICPDAHPGAGAVIGFTMPMGERIVPNTVGTDIGCGMSAYNLGQYESVIEAVEEQPSDLDQSIRDSVPLGRKTFGDISATQDYHIIDDFPWGVCQGKVQALNQGLAENNIDVRVDEDFGKEYFLDVCKRVGYDITRAINSIGTLGGGNHFIEISQSEQTGDYWVVVHSGSRGIGLSIANHWQERAHRNCDERAEYVRDALLKFPDWAYVFDGEAVSDPDLLDWVQGGMGQDWKNTDAIRDRLNGEEIGMMVDEMRAVSRRVAETDSGHELDYLDGDKRSGYLKDMVFAQTYAAESRGQMCQAVADAIEVREMKTVVSTHNYIDFEDLVIRKGATRVHEGERAIIPFNMADGGVIVEGLGNDEWNYSAPHGAGRRGSRRWAHQEFDIESFEEKMEGIYSSSVTEETIDESPMAYKDHESILEALRETATVVDVLEPRLNIKAEK